MNAGQLTTIPADKKTIDPLGKKFTKWVNAYLDPTSKTNGNATQSVLAVYKVKNYQTAAVMASQNLTKLKATGLAFVEQDAGIPVREWWKIAAAKAVKGSYEQTISFMERLGIIDPVSIVPANQNNFQFNFADLAASFTQSRKERGLPTEEAHSSLKDELKSNEANT